MTATDAPSVGRPPGDARVFRGWYVVAGVFVMLTVSSGIGFYGLSVYLNALTEQLGFSVVAVSGATALFFVVGGVAGLPIATWTAQHDPRSLVAGGAVACALALLALGRLTEVWQVYAAYALFGAGFAACSLVPGTTLVTRWFARRRALALSVATTGLSTGGVVVTPIVASAVDRHGLPATAPWLALAFVVVVVPVTVVLLRSSPQGLGLQPDGDPEPPGGAPVELPGTPAARAVRSRYFVLVTVAHLLAMAAQVGGMAHVYNLVAERRDAALAATALSILAGSSLVGRLLGGFVAARVSMRGMAVVLMAVQGCSLALLALVESPPAVLAATVLFGLTVGNLLMLHPLLLAERFGVRDYPRIYSRSQLAATIGIAAGPAVAGLLHDRLDGYGAAFAVIGSASVLAAVVLAASGSSREEAAAA